MDRPDAPPTAPRTRHRALAVVAVVVALIAIALAAGIAWIASESALRRALAELSERTGGALSFEAPSGSLVSTMRAARVVYRRDNVDVVADDVAITWSPAALRRHELRIDDLRAARIVVSLAPSNEPKSVPSSLALPFDVTVAHAAVSQLVVKSGDTERTLANIAFRYDGAATVHALRDVAVESPWGRVTGEGTLAAQPPFGLRGAFTFVGNEAVQRATANVTLGGRLDAIDVKVAARAHDATATGGATLAPFADIALVAANADARDVDPTQFGAALPAMRIAATIDARADAQGRYAGSVQLANGEPGPIDRGRVPIASLASRYALTRERLDLADAVVDLGAGGRASGTGHVDLATQARLAPSEWDVVVRDLDLARLSTRAIATRLSGRVRAHVERQTQHVDADLTEGRRALAFVATVAGDDVVVERFRARAEGGEASGRGRLSLAGAKRFEVSATAARFDPSRFVAAPKASLDGTIDAAGEIGPPWSATARVVVQPTSRFAGLAVSANAHGRVSAAEVADADVRAKLGDAKLHASGSFGKPGDALAFDVDVPRIAVLSSLLGERWPAGADGAWRAQGTLSGAPDAPGVDATAHATRLVYGGYSAAGVDVRATIAAGRASAGARTTPLDARAISLAVAATDLHTPEARYARATFAIDGSLARHVATIGVVGEDVDASARLVGGFAAPSSTASPSWNGTLVAFDNRGTHAMHLASPAPLAIARDRVDLGEARVAVADGTLRIATFQWRNARIESRGDFTGIPLAAIAELAGRSLPMRSTLVLGGDWNVSAAPRLAGSVHVRRERGDLYAGTGLVSTGQLALGLDTLDVAATMADDRIEATATMRASTVGTARATLTVGNVGHGGDIVPADAPVSATLVADMATLAPLQPLLGTTAVVDGRIAVDAHARGTRRDVALSGTVNASDVRIAAPQYGVAWTDGRLRARLADGALTLDELAFEAGDGRFTAHGTLVAFGRRGAAATTSVTWRAENFRALNRPDMRLVVDGNGTLGESQGRLTLNGRLSAREGHFETARQSAYTLGPDVVVAGERRAPPRERFDVPLAIDVDLDLGNRLDVIGRGLEARLAGNVHVATTPSREFVARGTVRTVSGTYDAFGQRLTITRGRLIFDGPIDNPALDVVAVRRNLPVEAGVEVTGTAKLPRVALTSDPVVPDNEKLAWLVLGHGLELTSATEAATLSAAAAALFGENRAPLGATLARRFGLDDISIRSATTTTTSGTSGTGGALAGQVVAVGKRLSDRVYVIYEQGLSAADTALKVEYVLTRNLTLRGEAGRVSGIGIYYQRSFD